MRRAPDHFITSKAGLSAEYPLSGMIVSGTGGLHHRRKHATRTHGDAAFAAAAFFGVPDDHMPVKPEVHSSQYAVFAFVDTRPAGRALANVRNDVIGAASSRTPPNCALGLPPQPSFGPLLHCRNLP
jgi:hypothetical protein